MRSSEYLKSCELIEMKLSREIMRKFDVKATRIYYATAMAVMCRDSIIYDVGISDCRHCAVVAQPRSSAPSRTIWNLGTSRNHARVKHPQS